MIHKLFFTLFGLPRHKPDNALQSHLVQKIMDSTLLPKCALFSYIENYHLQIVQPPVSSLLKFRNSKAK